MKRLTIITVIVFTILAIMSCKKGGEKANTQSDKGNLNSAEAVVNKYFEAIGGIENAKAVKTLITTAETKIEGQTMKIVSKFAAPNKFTTSFTDAAGNVQRQFFDGEKAFMGIDNQKMQMPPTETDIFRRETTPFADFAYMKGTLTGIEMIEGKKAYVVETKDKKVFYNVETGLKVKDVLSVEDAETGTQIDLATYYSDYREVNGIKFPHSVIQEMGEGLSMEIIYKGFVFNKDVTDKDFE